MKTAMTIAWGCIPSAYVVAESIQSCLGKPTHLGIAQVSSRSSVMGFLLCGYGAHPTHRDTNLVSMAIRCM